MAIPLRKDKPERLKPISEEAKRRPVPIGKQAKKPIAISKKTIKPKPNKISHIHQEGQLKQDSNSKTPKNTNKQLATHISLSPYFDPKSYKVMSVYEKSDYLIRLAQMPQYDTKEMDEVEARECVEEIKFKLKSVMRLCYELDVRKGYEALGRPEYENGYPNFKTCVMKELAGVINYDYAHKMKNAGEVHMVVCPEIPMGSVPESVLRPMHGLPYEEMKEVWKRAVMKCKDVEKVKKPIIEEVIKTGGFEKISTKTKTPINIEVPHALTVAMQKNAFNLIKNHDLINGNAPVSKTNFNKALGLLFNEVRSYVSDRYEKLHD